jgi:hypothetical protein
MFLSLEPAPLPATTRRHLQSFPKEDIKFLIGSCRSVSNTRPNKVLRTVTRRLYICAYTPHGISHPSSSCALHWIPAYNSTCTCVTPDHTLQVHMYAPHWITGLRSYSTVDVLTYTRSYASPKLTSFERSYMHQIRTHQVGSEGKKKKRSG